MSTHTDTETAVIAVREAAALIKQRFSNITSMTEKPTDSSIVTDVDKAADKVIFEILRSKSPYSIQSEERSFSPDNSVRRWVVDPIDGTTNYFRGIPVCAVSVALMEADRVMVGAICNPFSGDVFVAEAGKGAFCNDRRIYVSQERKHSSPLVFLNHGYGTEAKRLCAELSREFAADFSIRRLGSTVVELTLVAQGSADAFVCYGDDLWDYAAGILLVQEAGGVVTDWRGKSRKNENSFIVAAAPWLHPEVISLTQDLL